MAKTGIAAAALLFGAMTVPATRAAAEPLPVVVELFTSQGCSSCPPADELLGELARRDDVLPLSFHVTYWDRLGWPDTLGLEEGTARQETYAATLGLGRMYTPQMVIGGRIDVVGSARSRVMRALEILAEHPGDGPRLDIRDDLLEIGAGTAQGATIWLAAYDDETDVTIERGENRGRTITYHNAVRELTELGRFDGQALDLELPLARLRADGRDGVAILIQRDSDGAILAAAAIDLISN